MRSLVDSRGVPFHPEQDFGALNPGVARAMELREFTKPSLFELHLRLARLRESCGVYSAGRTIKFRRYTP